MRSKGALCALIALSLLQLPAGATDPADPGVGAAVKAAVEHVRAHAADFGLSVTDVADLEITDAYLTEHNGVTQVYLRQRLYRLEVLDADMTVGVGRDGRVFHTASRFLADLEGRSSGKVVLSPAEAFAAAVTELGAVTPTQTAPPRIVYQPTAGGRIRLAWNLEIDAGEHWWNVAVDSETGDVLAAYDYVVHDEIDAVRSRVGGRGTAALGGPVSPANGPGNDGASYNVFALPLESPNDGPRTLVTNPALPSASPYGWHDTNGIPGPEFTQTNGNNVHAAWDPTGPANGGQVLGLDAEGGSSLTFDFPLDTSLPPTTYKEAAITNLFYWNNIIHDVFYGYGFNERAGNFQESNYGKWPIGKGDPVQADAQDGGGVNNANFGTPGDGSSPRMQMFIWQVGRRLFDGDLDAGVIIHEYGHGISNRLTGGPSNVSCLNNDEQAGEGWSDFLAIATTVLPGDVGSTKRGLGTYVSGEPGRTSGGIRPSPYRTTSSTPTYNSIKSAAVPHGVGWVWASMLWDVFWAITDAYGLNPDVYGAWSTGGNNRAIQLVMDGMRLQACKPGFVDSRDAILAADDALTGTLTPGPGGEDRCRIWKAFARRGLGLSASQGSSASATDGTQAFDVPTDCV